MKIKPSTKLSGGNYRYLSFSKQLHSINTQDAFAIVNHKGRLTLALINKNDCTYRTCQLVSYSKALLLMNFFARYINMVKPTEATILTASTNAHCKGINRDQNKILAECFKSKDNE